MMCMWIYPEGLLKKLPEDNNEVMFNKAAVEALKSLPYRTWNRKKLHFKKLLKRLAVCVSWRWTGFFFSRVIAYAVLFSSKLLSILGEQKFKLDRVLFCFVFCFSFLALSLFCNLKENYPYFSSDFFFAHCKHFWHVIRCFEMFLRCEECSRPVQRRRYTKNCFLFDDNRNNKM